VWQSMEHDMENHQKKDRAITQVWRIEDRAISFLYSEMSYIMGKPRNSEIFDADCGFRR
jgi:hypothetical protein